MQTASDKAAFTIREFCSVYGVGKTFVYNQINSGRIKIRKAGSRTLILRGDAERWAEDLPEGKLE